MLIAKFQIYWGVGISELKSTKQGVQKSLPVHPPYLFNYNSPNLYKCENTIQFELEVELLMTSNILKYK